MIKSSFAMCPIVALVGGFLGAGKTTFLLAAAERLRSEGRRVGVVTNDQGAELVDTGIFCAAGFRTEEIAGGCFCCRFSDFLHSAERLLASNPEVILAEPVGSCTDLSATVLQPFKKFHGERFRLAPLTVLVDPGRAKVLKAAPRTESDADILYLFQQQIAEADVVLYTKADLYPEGQVSARTGQGIAEWLGQVLAQDAVAGARLLDIDYQRYARAEAALGWLNWQADLQLRRALTPAAVAGPFLQHLNDGLSKERVSIAHLKIFVTSSTGYLKAGICRNGEQPSIDGHLDAPPSRRHSLVLNLRASAAPELLQTIVDGAAQEIPGRLQWKHREAFRPAAPKPEHRFTQAL